MGNVEGQELNLEELTPEQRKHLQQQHELKLQQQQLQREQQQLNQRLQQQQLQEQQKTALDSSGQDIHKEQLQNPTSHHETPKTDQQRTKQNENQPEPQQRQQLANARVQSQTLVQQLSSPEERGRQQDMHGRPLPSQEPQRQPHRTQHLQQSSQSVTRTQITKSSDQFTESRVDETREDARVSSELMQNVGGNGDDSRSGTSESRSHIDTPRTTSLTRTERTAQMEDKNSRVTSSYGTSTEAQLADQRNRHERGRKQARGHPTRTEVEDRTGSRPTQDSYNQPVTNQRLQRTEQRHPRDNGDVDQNRQADTISSVGLQHPQKLPLEKGSQSQTEARGSPNGEKGYLTSSSLASSPSRSPMRSPMIPPTGDPFEDPSQELEADLSQLTEEERAHILAVLDRARQLQEKDENRVRDMEQNLEKLERVVSDRGYQSDSQVGDTGSCPVCYRSYRQIQKEGRPPSKDCDDCGRAVCPECGSVMEGKVDQKERWLCDLCHRRRRFVTTSGLWHKYYSKIQPKSRESRRSSLDEAFFAIQPSPKSKQRLVRTSSYSAVDDMRKNIGDGDTQSGKPQQSREDSESEAANEENDQDVDSDEIREEELLLLSRRSRDRSPEYERRTSAGQEEVLRHLRREERGFLVSDNTIEMDSIDAIEHVEDLSEGPDEEEMMRQLIEMADSAEEDYITFPDHMSSSSLPSDYFMGEDVDRYYGHQEILETTQQIAKFTELRNSSDYDLYKAATQEDGVQLSEDTSIDTDSAHLGDPSKEMLSSAKQDNSIQGVGDYKPPKPVRGIIDRVSSSLESSPAHDTDSTVRSSTDKELDYQHMEESHLKYSMDATSHSDGELEQKKDKPRKKREKISDIGGLGDSDQETLGEDKFLSVEDLREVGVDDDDEAVNEDSLMVPNSSDVEASSLYETKGNRPPAAGRGSGSSRRKKGQTYMESPLSPIRDDESETKQEVKRNHTEEEAAETDDLQKFTYPPVDSFWDGEDKEGELNEDDEEDEVGYDDDDLDDASSSYLTSPGGLETVMEEQEEPTTDGTSAEKRSYAYSKDQKKRIVTLNKDMVPEEIEDSSPEDSKSVLHLQEAPSGKRRSSKNGEESVSNDAFEDRLLHRRESPEFTSPERRVVRGHHRRSPEMGLDDRKETHSKDHPPLSRVSDSISPTASPVSSRFRFSPPITPKLCSTGKTFPEATFPKDLTPTETTHYEIVDENRNAIVDRQETTPTNELVGFAARGHHSPVHHNEKHRHPRKRHAVGTQTEKRRTQREMSTQTRSEYEMKRSTPDGKSTKSTGVQVGEDMDTFLPKKVLVDVGVETESDVSTTSSPVSLASSRSVGIDSRDPNYSSGMSSPVSDVGSERLYTEAAVQTLSDSVVQTDPTHLDRADLVNSSYYAIDRSTLTSPSLSYRATQDPKVADALLAVLGDYPPPSPRSYGIHSASGQTGKSDSKPTISHRGNGFTQAKQEKSRSHGMQTSNLNLQGAPPYPTGNSKPASMSDSAFARKKSGGGPSYPIDAFDQHDAKFSHSDTESVDSDLGTPKIRRRLPHVPADSSPSISPALGKTKGEETADLQAEIELDKVKGLLSRKAIQLEMERRKHELDEMTSKIFGRSPQVSRSSQDVSKYRSQSNHTDGTLSDSDILSQRYSLEKQENDRMKEQSSMKHSITQVITKEEEVDTPMVLDKEKYVQFSKSEEDIIREIERQVTQATGKAYSARDDDSGSSGAPESKRAAPRDNEYSYEGNFKQYEGKKAGDVKLGASKPYDQYDAEVSSQRFLDIDTSPVHMPEERIYPGRDHRYRATEDYNAQLPTRAHGAAVAGRRREVDGQEWKKEPSRETIPQLIKNNQNVDRVREGEEIERRIQELTALEEKLETDYQQYRSRVSADNRMRDSHPETLADYLLKSHDPSMRFEKTTDGQYEYTTAHWSNSDDSLSGSGSKLASSSSESRLLPARPSGDGSDERGMEGSGLILPLGEGDDFEGDVTSVPPPLPQRMDLPTTSASSSLTSPPKRDIPPVTVHSETRNKHPRQLPVPKTDPQHVSRSEGHRSHPGISQQPPVPRRSRGERTSNIFHLKRSSNGPSPGSGSGGDLGLRVVGGKRMPGSNQLVAYIADVMDGGAAQRAGLREGDQVLEWCGTPLTGKTFEEVQLIMRTARTMADVIVKCGPNLLESPKYRVTRPTGREAQRSHHHSGNVPRSSSGHGHRREPPSSGQRVEHPPRQVARPTSDSKPSRITGELQVRLAYDAGRGELRVDVLRGRGLVGKSNDGLADPFVVVRLLPMKSSSDEKRTACVPRTLTPEWNQTLLFRDLRASELLTNHSLELTIWSSSRNAENFMGKVIFNLSDTKHLDNRVHWYRLTNGGSSQGKSNKNIGFV